MKREMWGDQLVLKQQVKWTNTDVGGGQVSLVSVLPCLVGTPPATYPPLSLCQNTNSVGATVPEMSSIISITGAGIYQIILCAYWIF